jgi:hypothetical protein
MQHEPLRESVSELAQAASQLALRGAGCAVTVLVEDGSAVVASSHEWAQEVEQQLSLTGPSIHAVRALRTVVVDDWSRQGGQWPDCRRVALNAGVRSSMSLPLRVSGTVAALSFHDCAPNISRSSQLSDAPRLAAFASRVIGLALRLDVLQREAAGFERSMATAKVVNQAAGIVMANTRCTPEEALVRLDGAARRSRTTLQDVATGLIYRTTGRRPDSDIHFTPQQQRRPREA